jgi:hypothetical protein
LVSFFLSLVVNILFLQIFIFKKKKSKTKMEWNWFLLKKKYFSLNFFVDILHFLYYFLAT